MLNIVPSASANHYERSGGIAQTLLVAKGFNSFTDYC